MYQVTKTTTTILFQFHNQTLSTIPFTTPYTIQCQTPNLETLCTILFLFQCQTPNLEILFTTQFQTMSMNLYQSRVLSLCLSSLSTIQFQFIIQCQSHSQLWHRQLCSHYHSLSSCISLNRSLSSYSLYRSK